MSFTKVAPAGIGTEPGTSIRLGDSLLHSTGLDIGTGTGIGVTIRQHGDATFTGIVTAASFSGDITGKATELATNATGTNLTLSGNLGVGGVITYEDVTNIDSVGVITARSGIKIGPTAGVAGTFFADGSYVTAGIITAGSYRGDGSNLTGITQTTINNNATTKFITGTNNANELDCEANLSYNNSLVTFASSSLMVSKSTSPTISVKETAGNKEGAFRANTDGVLLRSLGNYPLIFHTNQTERAQIDGSGRFLIGTNSVYNANSYANNLIVYENGDAGASIIGNASNSNYASLYLSDTSTAIKGYLEAQLGANGNFTIGAVGTGPIRFTNNGSERFRITGDGKVSISSDGTTDGLLTIKGNSDQVGTPSIRLLDGSDTREVSITNTSGDFVASVHGNDNAIHGHIKMFESGIFDINNGGASGSNTNRLRIDVNGRVIINGAAVGSNEYLTIGPNGSTACDMAFRLNNDNDARIKFYDGGSTLRGLFGYTTYANDSTYPNFHDSFYMQTDPSSNGTLATALRISNSGQFIKPLTYKFLVETNGQSVSGGWAKLTGLTIDSSYSTGVSNGSYWSNSNSRFTAPVSGTYLFFIGGFSSTAEGGGTNHRYMYIFQVNGSGLKYGFGGNYSDNNTPMAGGAMHIPLNVNDYVEVQYFTAISATWGAGHRFFWGGYFLG